MTKKQADAARLLRILLSECKSNHDWHKCPRCLAFHQLESNDPFAKGLLAEALIALERAERPPT